jgi:hypothetical protein
MNPFLKFMTWFTCSLVVLIFFLELVDNDFIRAFIIALVLSGVAVKDET